MSALGYKQTVYFQAECPCKGCSSRSIGCHAICHRYKRFSLDLEEEKRAKKNADAISNIGYIREWKPSRK